MKIGYARVSTDQWVMILLLCGTFFGILGDVALRKAPGTFGKYFYMGCVLYACAGIPVTILYKHQSFANVAILWQAVNLILCMAVAGLVFQAAAIPMSRIEKRLVACDVAAETKLPSAAKTKNAAGKSAPAEVWKKPQDFSETESHQ